MAVTVLAGWVLTTVLIMVLPGAVVVPVTVAVAVLAGCVLTTVTETDAV